MHNLVADAADTVTPKADFIDKRLINPWGNVATATSPFWTCDYGTGLSTVYTVNPTGANLTALGTPNATLQPTVPGPSGKTSGGQAGTGIGLCTGIVANIAPATTPPTFAVTDGTKTAAANFIFVTEDGVLSAWSGGVDASKAFVEVDNGATANYKGLALSTNPPQLYAANFKTGAIDVFDSSFKPVTLASGAFTDPTVPAGYAPFNIWEIGGKLYVAYAKQDSNKQFDVPGKGNGYVRVFDTNGKLLTPAISGGALNSPWGLALAPSTFGHFAGDLLVGNFGDGLINVYDPATGAFVGTLQDATGQNIVIPGLWSLVFGNGASGGDKDTLYFTAGPGQQKHGVLGSINAAPNITSAAITNAAQTGGGIAGNTYVTIKGTNLAVTKRLWTTADFTGSNLPTALDGVTVTIGGKPAYVEYISPLQINVLTPADMPASGSVDVVVSNGGLAGTSQSVTAQAVAPSLFLFNSDKYVAAQHLSYALLGPTTLFANNAATPAKPGETVILYGTGFGVPAGAAGGQLVASPAELAAKPVILVNNAAANVVYAGLISPGLFQFDVTLPSTLPDGDVPVSVQFGGVTSPSGALITIKNP